MAKAQITEANKIEQANAVKAFKQSGEVENLYRFIHDNNLRTEALKLMKLVLKKTTSSKKKAKKKLQ